MSEKSNSTSGFHKLSVDDRIAAISEKHNLTPEETGLLRSFTGGLAKEQADKMIENVITTISLPVGIVPNFPVNGKNYDVPMSLEEPSVIAAVCKIRNISLLHGGFKASYSGSIMEAHVQLTDVPNLGDAIKNIRAHKEELLSIANAVDKDKKMDLERFGGGAKDIDAEVVITANYDMISAHFLVDCKEAMGANSVNKMAEAIAPKLAELTGGTYGVRILSNLATGRIARATATFDKGALGGEAVVNSIISAYEFADAYPQRGATHNKGIMNGIDAVAVALMQDWRALEAGAHAYAAFGHRYGSLTKFSSDSEGNLVGSIEMPMAVGTVGGSLNSHPMSKLLYKIMGAKDVAEFAEVMAAIGLAQNVGALRALVDEGIIKGHMALHGKKEEIKNMIRGETGA